MNRLILATKAVWCTLQEWFSRRYRTEVVRNDLPEILEKRRLYVVEESGYQESAALLCPCGCGQVLYLNLLEEERPCWRVRSSARAWTTVSPSIWRKTGCKSHFWLREGKIYWCRGLRLPQR